MGITGGVGSGKSRVLEILKEEYGFRVIQAGTRVDSHRFVPDVLRAGVRVLVTERDIEEELAASGLTEDEMGQISGGPG